MTEKCPECFAEFSSRLRLAGHLQGDHGYTQGNARIRAYALGHASAEEDSRLQRGNAAILSFMTDGERMAAEAWEPLQACITGMFLALASLDQQIDKKASLLLPLMQEHVAVCEQKLAHMKVIRDSFTVLAGYLGLLKGAHERMLAIAETEPDVLSPSPDIPKGA